MNWNPFRRKKKTATVHTVDNATDARLALVYTAPGGQQFYSCIDPQQLPAARGVAAERAVRFMNMNITEGTLRELLEEQARAQNAGDYTTAFGITREIMLRLDFLAEQEAMMELAAVYVYLREESPDIPTQVMHDRKMAAMRNDPGTAAFFLAIAQTRCTNFSNRPVNDLLSYLAETQGLAERTKRYLSKQKSQNGNSTSTN